LYKVVHDLMRRYESHQKAQSVKNPSYLSSTYEFLSKKSYTIRPILHFSLQLLNKLGMNSALEIVKQGRANIINQGIVLQPDALGPSLVHQEA